MSSSSGYDRGPSSGGSPYDRPTSASSSPYDRHGNGGSHPSTGPHKSVHGIGGFFHNLAHGAEAAARGFGPALATAGKDTLAYALNHQKGSHQFSRDFAKPISHQYAQMYTPLFRNDWKKFGHNVYNDPFGPILDAVALATGGAGAVAKGGSALAKAGVIAEDSRLAQLGRSVELKVADPARRVGQEGRDVVVKNSSHNPLIRARQQLINDLFNRLPAGTHVVGADARFARTIARTHMRPGLTLATKGHPFTQSFGRLNRTERAVWHLHARKLEPEMWKNLLESGAIKSPKGTEAATIAKLDKPKFAKLYKTSNKRIDDALEKGRELSDLMTDEKVSRGMLDELSAAEAPYAALRQVHGADFIGQKEADRTLPPKRLVATRTEVAAMQKYYDQLASEVRTGVSANGKPSRYGGFTRDQQKLIAASSKLPSGPDIEKIVPKSLEEAQAQAEELQKVYDDFIEKIGGRQKLTEEEQLLQKRVNQNNGKARKQASGRDKNGNWSGASGHKAEIQKDINVQRYLEAEKGAHEIALAHPDLPAAQKFLALSKKLDDLHSAISAHQEESFLGGKVTDPEALGTKTITKPGPREKPFAMPSGKIVTGEGAMLAPKGAVKLEMHGAALSLKKTRLEQLERAYVNRLAKLGGVKERGIVDRPGHSIPELAQRLVDEGKEQPFYVNDASKTRAPLFGRRPGIGEPAKMGSSRQNLGILLRKGMINLHGDSLTAEFARFARHVARSDVHGALLEHAAKVPETGLPAGWTHLLAKGERPLTQTEKNAGIVKSELAKGETKHDLLNRFTTKEDIGDIATDGEGHRLMIPDNVAKMLTHGATSESSLVKRFALEHPTSIWKHLVLGLRPAYMANIILSQHILGALQMAPNGRGFYAYLNNLIPGARLGKLTAHSVEEYMPEQAHGSFAASVGATSSKGTRVASKLYEGVMPATLKVENWLRRLMIEGWAASTPEIRAAMRENGGDINAAFADVAKSHPHVIDEISQKVDHAQGNYRTYSPAEQALRKVIPFYGWDRHIVQSTYRILAEHPLRAAAVAHLGQQGHAINERDFGALPTYLQDLVKISPMDWAFGKSNGRASGISTKAIGPFSSDADLAETLWSAGHGRAGTHTEEAGNINPLLAGLYEQLSGRSLLTGAPLKDTLNQGALNIPLRIALQTPQARLLEGALKRHPLGKPKHPPASQVSARLQLAGYLGLPVKRLDLAHEHLIAGLQGRPPR